MPLWDRLQSLGLLETAEAPKIAAKPVEKLLVQAHLHSPVRYVRFDDKTDLHKADLNGQELGEEDGSDSDSGYVSAATSESDASVEKIMIGDRERANKTVSPKKPQSSQRSWVPPPRQGQAEICRQLSRKTQRFVKLRHAVKDDDSAVGFHIDGFCNGVRVYRLDSAPVVKRLQDAVTRTAVGLSYVDIKVMCPPTVVGKAEKNDDDDDDEEKIGHGNQALATNGGTPDSPAGSAPPTSVPPPLVSKEVNGYFAIRPSPLGGFGSFALRDLPRGEHILVERPLVRTNLFHLSAELDKLTSAQRSEYYALHGYHPDPSVSEAERIWTANTFVTNECEGLFALASRFNHACQPKNNVGYHYDRHHDVLIMTAIKKIPAGAELLISYGKSPQMLFHRFGFRCTCGACSGFTEEMAKQCYAMKWS